MISPLLLYNLGSDTCVAFSKPSFADNSFDLSFFFTTFFALMSVISTNIRVDGESFSLFAKTSSLNKLIYLN